MENQLAVRDSRLPGFMKNAFESIEGMKQIAHMYAESRTIPDHFYEKVDNKPDYSKPKIASIQAVLTRGYELQLKPSTALQSIIPINGLLSLKVDLMKSMIFSSGTLASGGWIEKEEGNIEAGTYTVIITGKRKDNGIEMSRSFSIQQAKRAGLWVTQEMIQGSDGWKHKKSAWWKYNYRMVGTRAAGFLCRDLWGDVIDNSISYEEAKDYPENEEVVVIGKDGAEVKIPNKQFSEDRSKRITGNAAAMVDEFNDKPTEEVSAPVTEVHTPPVQTSEGGPEAELPAPFHWTEQALSEAKSDELLKACMEVGSTRDAVEIIPGKNTNKKLRVIILAYQKGQLDAIVRSYSGEQKAEPQQEAAPPTAPEQPDNDPDDGMEPIEGHDEGEVEPNLEFERSEAKVAETPKEEPPVEQPPTAAKGEGSIPEDTNKFGIEIPELSENDDRPFEVIKDMFFDFQTKAKLSNQMFDEMNAKMLNGKYKNMEEFCKLAPVSEINLLLNSVK